MHYFNHNWPYFLLLLLFVYVLSVILVTLSLVKLLVNFFKYE